MVYSSSTKLGADAEALPPRLFAQTQASLAEILHYAREQRQSEQGSAPETEKGQSAVDVQTAGLLPREVEKLHGWRTLRQTTLLGSFCLMTTDVIGPFNAPYAFRQNGYVSGILLYVFMGLAALYGGIMVWHLQMRLDSVRYPVRSYGDIADRIIGREFRIFVVFLVFVHMLVNVATTSLSNAQNLYQMTKGKICFIVAIVIWIVVGMVIGQIRSLKRYSILSSFAVVLNVSLVFISMGMIAHSAPNYAAAQSSYGIPTGPIIKQTFASYPLTQRINGVDNIVYAFGGATIFPQIISEMRRPMEFLRAFLYAQALIFSIYITYGLYVYSFQGQFSLPVAYQGVGRYSWQTVCNAIGLASTVIASCLYGNIGLKILYSTVVVDIFRGPPLLSPKGHIFWAVLVFFFWTCGFAVAAAIPQVQTLSGMVGAATNVQFTFSFPSGFYFIFSVREHLIRNNSSDTWKQWSRWQRGLFGGTRREVLFRWFNFFFCLAALSLAGLGMYGSGEYVSYCGMYTLTTRRTIKATFKSSSATSFSCSAPV